MEIANLKVYNDNMRKSLLDKAYFLSFVDSDTFIDFGCADGSLLKHIHEMFPDKKLIGYDISPEMLQIAEKNLEGWKVVQVNVDYTEEVNSSNKNWLNSDSRHCDILVRSDDAETIKYSGTLSQSQVEHIVFLIQDNYSAKDIKDQIIEYGVQNLSPTVTPQIGDPEFLEE